MLNSAETGTDDTEAARKSRWGNSPRELILYAAGVLFGAALITITAIQQPYNQNEWKQIAPYGSSDPSVVASGTRQPPLDAWLGALVQHALGEGQLRQRLVPVLCGIGSLILMAALLRGMRRGHLGVLALWVMATAPLFVRYSAYIRPYALPTFLMLACCYAGTRWLADGRRGWLAAATVPALLLPLARVPEPVVFMGTSMLVLVWAGLRRTLPRGRAWALAGMFLLTLATVGYHMFHTLQSRAGKVFDTNPGHVVARIPAGLHELKTYLFPVLFAHWFAWWPVVVVFVVLAIVLKDARRTLGGLWFWLPLLAAPLVFVVAYHTLNPVSLEMRHYRARFAYFFIPPLIVLVAAVGDAVSRSAAGRKWGAWVGAAVVGVLLVSQLPTTVEVATENDVPDYGQAGAVLHEQVPSDGLVLYDSPTTPGRWRQPFSGRGRYLGKSPSLVAVTSLDKGIVHVKAEGPVYLLILDSECATSVVCDLPANDWSESVAGYRLVSRFDRFTLFAPEAGQRGTSGAIEALGALADAYGPHLAVPDVMAQARLLMRSGLEDQAHRRIAEFCPQLGPKVDKCLRGAASRGLFPPS